MNCISPKVILCVGIVTLLLGIVVDSAKYTEKELEQLRKFYYDDLDDESQGSLSDEKGCSNKKDRHFDSSVPARPESRSYTRKGPDGDETTQSSPSPSAKTTTVGPGELVKDARKYLDAGRKAIDRAADWIRLPLPPLPRMRTSRDSGGSVQLIHHLDQWNTDNGKATAEENKQSDEENVEDSNADNDSSKSHSTSTTASGEGNKDKGRHRIFKNPFAGFENDASQVAADTGGKILSILNKLTPPPILGLPTPLPNLEDFGG